MKYVKYIKTILVIFFLSIFFTQSNSLFLLNSRANVFAVTPCPNVQVDNGGCSNGSSPQPIVGSNSLTSTVTSTVTDSGIASIFKKIGSEVVLPTPTSSESGLASILGISGIFSGITSNGPVITSYSSVDGIIEGIIMFVFSIAGLLFFVTIIWGGYMIMMSEGEKSKVEKARKTLTTGFIGILLVILSFAIVEIVLSMIGFPVNFSFTQLFSTITSAVSL